ncbi:hypothetical protein ABS772_09540 [Methylorubrum podarium]|uniref:Uncharacterized protein n=1 Tax=Methylorubrum podarium TaxID=200476 RepID=A0ABV1QLA1_9HYPH
MADDQLKAPIAVALSSARPMVAAGKRVLMRCRLGMSSDQLEGRDGDDVESPALTTRESCAFVLPKYDVAQPGMLFSAARARPASHHTAPFFIHMLSFFVRRPAIAHAERVVRRGVHLEPG